MRVLLETGLINVQMHVNLKSDFELYSTPVKHNGYFVYHQTKIKKIYIHVVLSIYIYKYIYIYSHCSSNIRRLFLVPERYPTLVQMYWNSDTSLHFITSFIVRKKILPTMNFEIKLYMAKRNAVCFRRGLSSKCPEKGHTVKLNLRTESVRHFNGT